MRTCHASSYKSHGESDYATTIPVARSGRPPLVDDSRNTVALPWEVSEKEVPVVGELQRHEIGRILREDLLPLHACATHLARSHMYFFADLWKTGLPVSEVVHGLRVRTLTRGSMRDGV